MKDQSLVTWVLANALALGLAFVVALEVGMLVEYGFNTELHWKFIPPGQTASAYAAELLSSLAVGALLGSVQAVILGSRSVRVLPWILVTTAGFGLTVAVSWPLMAAHVWGRIPGPVEPIVLLHGGGGLAGILQYLMLSRQGIHARKWMVLWIVGLVANLLPTALLFISLDKLGVSISWPAEAFLNGFMVAGVAASISGKALFAALAEASPEEAASEGAV